jgi:hypothetical protein
MILICANFLFCDQLKQQRELEIINVKKEAIANELYGRIEHALINSSLSRLERRNIRNRILEGKDTLYFLQCTDFQICITLHKNKALDSLNIVQDSIKKELPAPQKRNNSW